jgi:putative ABC transport system ATP-binding protein
MNAIRPSPAPIAEPSLLEAREITKTFGAGEAATHAVRGVSCEFRRRELALLMGPSGSGKTTLVSMLAGLLKPTSGRLRLGSTDVTELGERELARIRRRRVGFVFQGNNLFPALTALNNVAEAIALKEGAPWPAALARARALLSSVGLEQKLHCRPGELSGGQQQRVALARALAGEPEVIIGDEVTAALDGAAARSVMELLRERVTAERTILLVTHDPRLTEYADRIVEMRDGVIVADGPGARRASTGEVSP